MNPLRAGRGSVTAVRPSAVGAFFLRGAAFASDLTCPYLLPNILGVPMTPLAKEFSQQMALYRVYKISPDNHITTLPDIVNFSDDEDVIAYAKTQLNGQGVEVWDGTRVVIRLVSTENAPSVGDPTPVPPDAPDRS
jgi:hypothetical protein